MTLEKSEPITIWISFEPEHYKYIRYLFHLEFSKQNRYRLSCQCTKCHILKPKFIMNSNSTTKELKSSELIKDLLDEIKFKKKKYYRLMRHYKRIDDITESLLIGSNAIAVSSLIVTLATINPISLIIGASLSTVSTVGSAIKRVIDIRSKFESYRTTYNQLSDLFRETKIVLAKNHLTPDDYQSLLNDVSNRLSLIEDSALPIKIESRNT